MARLACPHCARPIAANPIGRWYSKFQCPHCRGALRFSATTNTMGLASSVGFFMMIWALVMGRSPIAQTVAIAAGAAWLALMGLSYVLRGIEKG